MAAGAHKALPGRKAHLVCTALGGSEGSLTACRHAARRWWVRQLGTFAVTLLPPQGPGPPATNKGEDNGVLRALLLQPYACLLPLPSKTGGTRSPKLVND